MAAFPRNAANIIKFAAGVLLLPVVYAFSISFISEFNTVKGDFALYFWAGTVSFALFYIFIYEPELIYNYGQEALSRLFTFYKPLPGIAAYALPAYTLALLILYWALSVILSISGITYYFLLLIGFSSAMHLVFTARALNRGRGDFLKANYLFGFSLVYLSALLLLACALGLMLKGFSFGDFFANSLRESGNIFNTILNRVS